LEAEMHEVLVRYFAGVAEAAGTREERLSVAEGTPVAAFLRMLDQRHGAEFARQLAISAIVSEGARLDEAAILPVREGIAIDVLPPFAGG
jgi:molybdopterin converting factor small subunit